MNKLVDKLHEIKILLSNFHCFYEDFWLEIGASERDDLQRKERLLLNCYDHGAWFLADCHFKRLEIEQMRACELQHF